MRLYLDSSAIIYLVEGVQPFQQRVLARVLRAETSAPPSLILTSRLAILECRVKPLRNSDSRVLELYNDFFSRAGLQITELDATVLDLATEYRARHGYKTPDAIHLASATISRADVFLTGDTQLARCPSVNVEVL